MCSRPLQILSRKADKNPVFDKLSYTVPCGHCEECKKQKRLSWFVRLYYQWQDCIDHGGFALFLTLTYNNKNIPKLNEKYPCFCVADVQKYLKRFRQKLCRLYPHIDWKSNIKYFCSSEYGGKTHRPHYHIVVFCSIPCNRWTFRLLLSNSWELGYTKYGNRNYGFVDSVGGLNYCAKYVCKDVYEDKYLNTLIVSLKHDGLDSEELKKLKPFVLSSNGLGLYALGCSDYDLLKRGSILMPDSKYSEKAYKLPLYYERKLFYDVKFRVWDFNKRDYLFYSRKSDIPDGYEFTPVYILNADGIEMKKERFNQYVIAARNIYRLSLFCLDTDLTKLNLKFKTDFDSLDRLKSFVFNNINEETFVNYVSVYRGCVPASGDFSSLELSSTPVEDFETSLEVKQGLVYDRTALQSFLSNLRKYLSIPDLDLKVNIILYLYSLARASLEDDVIRQEMDYVNQKSVYLKETEYV